MAKMANMGVNKPKKLPGHQDSIKDVPKRDGTGGAMKHLTGMGKGETAFDRPQTPGVNK